MATATLPGAPTFGDLIDMLEEAEDCSSVNNSTVSEVLYTLFQTRYPTVVVRPQSLYNAAKRIAAPTNSSLRGTSKLSGTALSLYRRKEWLPRIRTTQCTNVAFPSGLVSYGLSEDLLGTVFDQFENHEPLSWSLRGIPDHGFYQDLHPFLKKWPRTQSSTKSSIGKFYSTIDMNLNTKSYRPDNAYRFIERLVLSQCPRNSIVKYGLEPNASLQSQVKECMEFNQKLISDLEEMKKQRDEAKRELNNTQLTLREALDELKVTAKCKIAAEKKVSSLQNSNRSRLADYNSLAERLDELEEENLQISEIISSVKKELSIITDATAIIFDEESMSFAFQTKCNGKQYSPAIRKLYYSLLSDQIPPTKIFNTIKTVLKCFFPGLDVELLQLPKARCAGYMRTDELSTLSLAHKATTIHNQIEDGSLLHLNTDGTTLGQKKLGGMALNKVVISVSQQSDGTADSIISDVSRQLQKLRETASALGLPNSSSINWTMISSSTADSAATQKRFNKLIEQKKEADKEEFGTNAPEIASEFIENFCAMHLGSNLRKAFLVGVKSTCDKTADKHQAREYYQVDIIVHEFHKLFGRSGAPEYGCGTLLFPDFLHIMANDTSLTSKESDYYNACLSVTLDRQVGSRYFVTAANASKVLFLKDAALSFLRYTFRHVKGNKLEEDIFAKLNSPAELIHLKLDGLMFYHIYADLVQLAKSQHLKKSVLDMNDHYFELQKFLKLLQEHPQLIMDKDYRVFSSESLLYGNDEKFNHRIRFKSIMIYKCLFSDDTCDTTLLYSMIAAGACAMEKKLNTYAKAQLPGGIYWNPEPEIQEILRQLEPSNDICESILGHNDYLSTAVPNLCQQSRSNLIEVKKNNTIKWLDALPEQEQDKVLDLAMEYRVTVAKERKKEKEECSERRREQIRKDHNRKVALLRKAQDEKDKLSNLHLITTSQELYQCIEFIDKEDCLHNKKKAKKCALLREQINIRKKVLDQNLHIVFSHARQQRPVEEIVKELSDFIQSTTTAIVSLVRTNPASLLGKHISHKFEIEDSKEKWYVGTIISYDFDTRLFEIVYEEEEEHCYFDLTEDAAMGDLVILGM